MEMGIAMSIIYVAGIAVVARRHRRNFYNALTALRRRQNRIRKHCTQAIQSLPLPPTNLGRIMLVFRCNHLKSLVAAQSLKGDLGLEIQRIPRRFVIFVFLLKRAEYTVTHWPIPKA